MKTTYFRNIRKIILTKMPTTLKFKIIGFGVLGHIEKSERPKDDKFPVSSGMISKSYYSKMKQNTPNDTSSWLQYGEQNVWISIGKNRFHVSLGAMDLGDSQKWHLKLTSVWKAKCMDFLKRMIKVDLSMKSKMYGFPWANDRFHVTLGMTDLAGSQK